MEHLMDLGAIGPDARLRFGSKAANLGRLITAGLPVPKGFCIDETIGADNPMIAAAYQRLGGGRVAVRSSAVDEDTPNSAAAGLYATQLGVREENELAAAIDAVRRSANTNYFRAYQPGGPPPQVAVVVQRLVDADIAGVVFTRDPADDTGKHLAVAAAWGLGTTVVDGGIADRFRIERATGQVAEQSIAHKLTRQTVAGVEAVPAVTADAPSLTCPQILDLTKLAIAAEQVFGEPLDIEWAFADGSFWLLQARPITTFGSLDLTRLREREISRLRALADSRSTVWTRYQLAESAPHPTPMTWAVLRSMLSVRDGYGRMLRALGFDPDLGVDEKGFVQLIAGQPYLNLNLEARLDHRDIPYSVNIDRLKRDPALALLPQRDLFPGRTPLRFWLRLPVTMWRLWRQARRLRRLRDTYANLLTKHVFPAFAEEVARARQIELAKQTTPDLLVLFEEWRRRTLVEFAESALQPAVFAGLALQEVIAGADGQERERRLAHLQEVLAAAPRSTETDQPAALRALLQGSLDLSAFLERFGHRGPEELELAQPRWRDVPPEVDGVKPQCARRTSVDMNAEPPAIRHYCEAVALRETSRHFFMRGYSFLRDVLLVLDRRFELAGGIFFLRPEELSVLAGGTAVRDRIRVRRREHMLLRSLAAPTVLFGDDLEAIGRPAQPSAAAQWSGRPISPGFGEGPALVASSPDAVSTEGRPGFVLVCPYVDAAWLPSLVRASAVILETGTDLSHGAILLREFGIPAVAGLPGITSAVTAGERLRVDARNGEVARLGRD
jgi:pyruvate,water dikinase